MRHIIIFLIALCLSFTTHAQKDNNLETTEVINCFLPYKESPVWINGTNKELVKRITSKIIYPAEQCLEGTTFLQFKVDTTGTVFEPKIRRSISQKIDSQLLNEIIKHKFTAGTIGNKKHNFSMIFPFNLGLAE